MAALSRSGPPKTENNTLQKKHAAGTTRCPLEHVRKRTEKARMATFVQRYVTAAG